MQINVLTIISTLMSVLMGINARFTSISNWETCSQNSFDGGWTDLGLLSGFDKEINAVTSDRNTLNIIYSADKGVIHFRNKGATPFQYYIEDRTTNQRRWLMHAIAADVHHMVHVKKANIWARAPLYIGQRLNIFPHESPMQYGNTGFGYQFGDNSDLHHGH